MIQHWKNAGKKSEQKESISDVGGEAMALAMKYEQRKEKPDTRR